MCCAQYEVSETNGVVAAQAMQRFAGSLQMDFKIFAEFVYPRAAWDLQISGWWITFVLVKRLIPCDFLAAVGLSLPVLSVKWE